MHFYYIGYSKEKYQLVEDVDGQVEISERQLFNIVEGLSQLYRRRETLPLGIRTYITAYYSNDTMEYISLESCPSQVLSQERRMVKGLNHVEIDGFAATFLEDTVENRIWIGLDGAIENRGPSKEKVEALLELLIEHLNEDVYQERQVWEHDLVNNREIKKRLLSLHERLKKEMTICDRNQQEISWLIVKEKDKQYPVLLDAQWDTDEQDECEYIYPIITTGGLYQLRYQTKSNKISLLQLSYSWEKKEECQGELIDIIISELTVKEGRE